MGTTLSLRTGQLAADTEFINAKYTDVFTNASMGWPAITSVNLPSGGPSPPLAALDARLRADLTDNCTVSAAIFDGNAAGPGLDDPQLRDNHGVNFRINDPLLLIGEVQYIWTAPIRTFASAEGETLLASPHGIHACTDEIADRFMNRIKNPDRS
jgi:porin